MSILYSNPSDHQTRLISGGGGFPWVIPYAEEVNDFLYDADVTKLTWRVSGGGVSAPTARGVTVPGGALSYTLGAVNNGEVGFQDPGQVYECKRGTNSELIFHTAIPTPTTLAWMFGWLAAQGATLISAPQNGIVVYSGLASAVVQIRVYKAGVVEQTITTDAVIGTDPAAIALTLDYKDNTNELFVRMAVNGRPVLVDGGNSAKITAAHIPTAALLATGGLLQPAAGAASVNWRMLLVGSTVSRFYTGGTFGFGDNTGSGSGSGGGTSSGGGGLGAGDIGAIE